MKVDVSPEVQKYAHQMVAEAVKGDLLRRSPCEACGSQSNVDGHHDDYSQPLSVRWLCRSHHLMTHRTPGFKMGGGNDAPTFDMSRLGMLCPGSRYDSRRKRRADGSYVSDAEKAVDWIERKNRQRKRSRNRKRTEQRSRKRAEKRAVKLMRTTDSRSAAEKRNETLDAKRIWGIVREYGYLPQEECGPQSVA